MEIGMNTEETVNNAASLLQNISIFGIINGLILLLLALSTLIGILDFVGFLPRRLRNWFHINRSEDTKDVLNRMGFNLDQYQQAIQAYQYPRSLVPSEVEKVVSEELERCKINKSVSVGRHIKTTLPYYYDLIGASCDPGAAKYLAGILSTYWSMVVEDTGKSFNTNFDFVVTPKGGSPILGYEFASVIGKPFALHEEEDRFQTSDNDMRKRFDCREIPPRGATALIVDDSTTGGSMVRNTISDLRHYGYQVHACLVVFVPQVKKVAELLLQDHVHLVPILKTHRPQENQTATTLPPASSAKKTASAEKEPPKAGADKPPETAVPQTGRKGGKKKKRRRKK